MEGNPSAEPVSEGSERAVAAIELASRLHIAIRRRIDHGEVDTGQGACALALALIMLHRESGSPREVLVETLAEAERVIDAALAGMEAPHGSN